MAEASVPLQAEDSQQPPFRRHLLACAFERETGGERALASVRQSFSLHVLLQKRTPHRNWKPSKLLIGSEDDEGSCRSYPQPHLPLTLHHVLWADLVNQG